MLFIANAQGTILNTVPDRVYQGSNNANQVLLAIPLPSSVTITVAYKLPNGLLTEPAAMTYNEQEIEGNPLNVWSIDIPEAITTYYGTVTAQFVATNSQGVKIASGSATFEVERGVAPVLPATPTQDIYDQILQALSAIKEDMLNGWLESKALLPYDSTFTYTQNAVVFNSSNKELYKSLIVTNKGNALTDTTKWQALGFEKAFSDIAQLQTDLTTLENTVTQLGESLGQLTQKVDTIDENVTQNTSDIADIENGTITVGKATNDANGNNIANTYQTKSNLTTSWGQVLSDTKYPSEKLVKTTINDIVASGGKQSFVFNTQADFLGWINGTFVRPDGKVVSGVNIADDILIKEQSTPDYWCSSKSEPMTIADFTEYEAKTNLTDYLAKDNTEEFTPTGDYNPATKKYVDDNGVSAVNDVNLTIGQETVSYNSEDGITINSNGQITYGEKTKAITVEHDIPIVAGNGINIDKLSDKEQVEIKAVAQYITLDVPATATNGTLTAAQLETLQNSEIVGIMFNNELYTLNAKEHTSGYLTYSMVEYENNISIIKTITITINTLGWVLNAIKVNDMGNIVLEITNTDQSNPIQLTDEQYNQLTSNKGMVILLKNELGDYNEEYRFSYETISSSGSSSMKYINASAGVNGSIKTITLTSSDKKLSQPVSTSIQGLLIPGRNIIITEDNNTILASMTAVSITDVPSTATSGTLTAAQLQTLQTNKDAYILFNNEKYYLMDVQHDSGMLVYSHVGQDTTNDFFIKCISVTTSTRGWVLTTLDMNDYEKVETIYDMNSTDANLNWGYTSGIGNGVTVNKNFSKYKMLICQYQSYDNAVVAFCDLTTPTTPADQTGRYVMYAVGYIGNEYSELISIINLEKTTLTTYLPGEGVQASKITKLYGVY